MALLHLVAAQQTNGSVPVGASLTATPDAKPWLSSSGEFALGFQQVQDNFLIKVDLIDRRGLVLTDPQGKELWSSRSISDLAYAYMNDTGNFVIAGRNSRNIWESFDHPADTILPTQGMPRGGVINSKMGKTNFTKGRFQLRLLLDGNLVLNTLEMFSGSAVDLTVSNSLPSGDYSHRATLDSDGVFTQYYYPKNLTEATSWRVIWLLQVKKLETMVKDGQKEFKTEVNTIPRTHHKNLVQLLGYCDDGERRLLIFEYMSNGTLAFFLFGDSVVFDDDAEDVTVLTDLAWDCYHEGRLDAFVKNDLEALMISRN
ncbi:hypothetical protein L1987_00588 [Smallanthus sonchifolius]|uniref:Uncharacterized protein n=1 Tax=Smallanthus sonchifolius TaxID=185202 RepID=A0ACB9K2W5_9ASTR|nr:hypothetical protein L1987_00588 [Smallanthus sonchifolius]